MATDTDLTGLESMDDIYVKSQLRFENFNFGSHKEFVCQSILKRISSKRSCKAFKTLSQNKHLNVEK